MSLTCLECLENLKPDMVFPGREGGILYPNTASVFSRAYVESNTNAATCFECLLGGCEGKERATLTRVFASYNAEVEYNRFRAQYRGFVSDGVPEGKQLKDSFDKVRGSIPSHACLYCEGSLPARKKIFFTFRVMDRLHGETRKSFFGAYQWSLAKTGLTSFLICRDCMNARLPRSFGYLTGAKDIPPPKMRARGSEITIFEELTQEQVDTINRHLPSWIRFK